MGGRKSKQKKQQKLKNSLKNRGINDRIKQEQEKMENTVKILVLGTGESGKSTFVKQIQILYKAGFSKRNQELYKTKIQRNLIFHTKELINGLPILDLEFKGSKRDHAIKLLESKIQVCSHETPDITRIIKALWGDDVLKSAFDQRSKLQIPDTHGYFLDALDRIVEEDYVPNNQDILNCRIPTTGVITMEFEVNERPWCVVDVGGQRSERRKWIHQFDDVDLIVYVVAISEFDQKLFEDESVNRMKESLDLFDSTVNNEYFHKTQCVLLLNKLDLFKTKITKERLQSTFPEYDGDGNFEDSKEFITNKFLKLGDNRHRKIKTQYTCANVTDNIKQVFDVIQQMVLENCLKDLGKL
ncbi:guanine nucleotide-binding protein g(o) subunit alpha [Anaeramoeba flamelloides]|uniref:Guanine nucleotide-binding protein g(O) subunit alpha n=1 Tax=Anaeramoeba flamelloides TaxID=1746091 RepID=A0AAV7Y3T6_9EUKA|nr:guanine nucleotide-binding protein g(o) subunit alpha [Anaeramoeba flamelloides]KAJ6253439.1 guanine nucleotide-binding protein g(o) subunit alpha [Anaeramoeba flamelloides]